VERKGAKKGSKLVSKMGGKNGRNRGRSPSDAALVRKVLVVSKLICKKGEEHSFMPSLFMGKYDPVRVMKSAIRLKWRGFTSIP
jgi:hypothetical protein